MRFYDTPTGPYLTEKLLGEALVKIFPNHEFIHNRKVPNSNINNRPDFRNDDLMLIIEFDGNRHFQNFHCMQMDRKKDIEYEAMGYAVVRIPYFVQLSSDTIFHYFNIHMNWEQEYPHGFIDSKAVIPTDFSSTGYDKYMWNVLDLPSDIIEDIQGSEMSKFVTEFNKIHGVHIDITGPSEEEEDFIKMYVPWFRSDFQFVSIT